MQNIIGGLIAIVIGIYGLITWWSEFGQVLRGVVPFLIIIIGLLSIASKYYKQLKNEAKK